MVHDEKSGSAPLIDPAFLQEPDDLARLQPLFEALHAENQAADSADGGESQG